jgi:D-alanyl-D-alanine endopeptidase (penicillin-binding protein 7)
MRSSGLKRVLAGIVTIAWLVVAAATGVAATIAPATGAAAQPKLDLGLASVSAIAVDVDSGDLLVAKYPDAVLPIASITKLMTAIVVVDSGVPLDERLAIRASTAPHSKNAFSRLRVGSTATRADLLRVALMSSENLAAYNLGAHDPDGLDAFVARMNAKAATLGMMRTVFVDPTGLSPDNRSTARDLASMVRAANGYDLIREYSTTKEFTVDFREPRYRLGFGTTNPLTYSAAWDVALQKTGYLDEAGRCLAMIATAGDARVAMVMLNSFGKRSPLGDAGRIRRWLETGTVSSVSPVARDYAQGVVRSRGLDTPGLGG